MKSFFFLLGLVIGTIITGCSFRLYQYPDSFAVVPLIFLGVPTMFMLIALAMEELNSK